jgi:ppGpp synthetase/RelA/SpoT-type nucleotidyltranferase
MSIDQPRWKIPEYTQRQINDAGITIRNNASTNSEKAQALEVIDNWRSAHAYPLHVFYMNLRGKAESRSDVITAERLKRLDSIAGKLQRESGMDLYRMQDLGGCRVVLPTLEDVYSFSHKFQNSRIRHELKKTNDYIQNPKPSGYRSLHLVYRFQSDTPEKEVFNRYNMLIELQFRTHLQHVWATAVEAIGAFTNQALKAGQGEKSIKRFFVLVSSLFAIREGCPVVPN